MFVLFLTDGTVTVDFVSDSDYRLISWGPAVAQRRKGELGGYGPYEDVVEEMEIFIGGATPMAKLAELRQVMDTADRVFLGEKSDYAFIQYQPLNTSPAYAARILGDAEIILPGNYDMANAMQAIDPVILRFRRRGLWTVSVTDTATSSAVAHPAIASISGLTAVDSDSPLNVSVAAMAEFGGWDHPWYILKATTSNNLIILAAEDLASGTYTSVADAASDAKDTNVLRYTPGVTTWVNSGVKTGFSMNNNVARWGVFINYRNNSTTTSFSLTVDLCNIETPEVYIPPSPVTPSLPRWVFAGYVALPDSATETLGINVKASAAAGTVDFDSIVILAMDTPNIGQAVEIVDGLGRTAGAGDFHIKHNLRTAWPPRLYRNAVGNYLTYTGDPIFILPAGHTALEFMVLATDGTQWVPCNNAGTPYSTAITAIQDGGYLIPE